MRPPVPVEARRSHLQPCPRCGEANGVTAIACWKCDLQLIPDHLLEPRGPASRPPPIGDVPLVDAEVPAEMLEHLRAARHDGPHTLPPLAAPPHGDTANDPHFGSAWASPQFRLLWVAVGVALAAALLAWLVPRAPVERAQPRAGANVAATVKQAPAVVPAETAAPKAAATTAPATSEQTAAPATPNTLPPATPPVAVVPPVPQAALPPTGARGAVARAQPADVPRPATPRVSVAPPVAVQPRPAGPRDDGSARRIEEATRRADAEAARRPAPVQAACTAQVAALGLCDSK